MQSKPTYIQQNGLFSLQSTDIMFDSRSGKFIVAQDAQEVDPEFIERIRDRMPGRLKDDALPRRPRIRPFRSKKTFKPMAMPECTERRNDVDKDRRPADEEEAMHSCMSLAIDG